jgi:hypothetical protein
MAMVLSVFLEFTASYYIFGIFKPCYRVENTTKHKTVLAMVLSLFLEFTASYYIFDIRCFMFCWLEVGGFLRVLRSPPPITLTPTI